MMKKKQRLVLCFFCDDYVIINTGDKMLYLDYCATTFPSKKVLKAFNKASKKYVGNPNSSHFLGVKANNRIKKSTSNIAKLLKVGPEDIIYTSGASEANNLAIKGVCRANKGKHIITTKLEHSSVMASINRLLDDGYDVSFLKLNTDGTIDIDNLKEILTDDTVLVSIVGVDSEMGIKQDINLIGKELKKYPNCYFHVDATQMVGKTNLDFKNVDLISFSAHKFFGIKGIGCLVKQGKFKMIPLIDGGRSTTKYRSGTPALELIVSLEKALTLAYKDFDKKLRYVNKISNDLKGFLSCHDNIKINSTSKSIPQVINFSVDNSRKLVDMLTKRGVCLSTKSACSSLDSLSKSVMSLYDDEKRANNSVRISLSYLATRSQIRKFKKIFNECYDKIGENDENN